MQHIFLQLMYPMETQDMTTWTIEKPYLGGCMEIFQLDKLKSAQSCGVFFLKKMTKEILGWK